MTTVRKAFLSSILLVLLSVGKKLVGLVSTLILARILTPEDFGLVAIATLAFGLVEVLSQSGSSQYIITREKISEKELNTAFTYNLILKSLIAFIFYLTSPIIAEFYGDDRITSILEFFSLMLLIIGFENPQIYLLKKNQEYKKIVKMIFISKIISTIFAISTALIIKNYWALIAGQMIAYSLPIIGGYIISPYMPRIELKNIKSQFSFSAWLVPSSMLGYFRSQIDTIIISKLFDSHILGNYHVMKYLAFIPTQNLIGPLTQPLLAQLTSVKNSGKYFLKMFNVSMFTTLFIAVFISTIFLFQHKNIVYLLLGEQWVSNSKILAIFGVLIISTALNNQATNLLMIKNKNKYILIFESMAFFLIIISFIYLDLNSTIEFVNTKVTIEFLYGVMMILISSKFLINSFSATYCILLFSPIFLSAAISCSLAQYLFKAELSSLNLIIWSATFSALYFSITYLTIKLLSSKFEELQYINKKISASFVSIRHLNKS